MPKRGSDFIWRLTQLEFLAFLEERLASDVEDSVLFKLGRGEFENADAAIEALERESH